MSAAGRHRFLEGLRPTLHISHRGGALLAPENTMHAFREAVDRHRTDVLELDVQATRDGALVVSHDPTLDRCTDGAGPIASCTLAELQRLDAAFAFSLDGGRSFPLRGRGVRVPLLRDVLRAFAGVSFNIELKADGGAARAGGEAAFADEVRRAGAMDRVCIGSEDDALAERLVAVLPDACHFFPRNALTRFVMALKSGDTSGGGAEVPYRVLDMPLTFQGVRLIDPPFLAGAAALGRWVNVWTIDDADEMTRLVAEGVGGVMTDRPDLLREVLDRRG